MSYNPNLPAGQAASSASAPVVIANDQTAIAVQQNDAVASGTLAVLNAVVTSPALVGISTVSIQVTGTWAGTLTPYVSLDGTSYFALNSTGLLNTTTGAYSATITSASQGIWQADIAGFKYFQLKETIYTSGTATIALKFSNATGMVGIDNPLPPGTNAIGGVTVSSLPTLATVTSITNPVKVGGATSGGSTPYLLISAATTNSTLVSTGAHTLYAINAYNNGATAAYLKIYDKSTAPTVGTDTPKKTIMLPPGGGSNIVLPPQGDVIASGLGLAITALPANTDATAVALNQCVINMTYS